MSVRRPDPAADAAAVREATAELLDAVAGLDPAAVAGPSRLPGWTRGHVLTHLARNADALVNLLTWARTGEEAPMYPSRAAREEGIEAGAARPLEEQLADLRGAAERFDAAVAALAPGDWAAQVRFPNDGVGPAAEIPARRLTEVHLHHVDLDVGRTCADLPAGFVARELADVLDGLAGREGIAAVRLRDTESGTVWDLGAADRPEMTVAGPAAGLLGWVTGRSDGGGLTVEPELPLPMLPPLG